SPQLVELCAVVMVFQRFPHVPLNVVTDSAYVADIADRLDCSLLKEVDNVKLFCLLKTLWHEIQNRTYPYYILHVRSRTHLPGFITEGNARADKLASPAWTTPLPDKIAEAMALHGFFHQDVRALQKQFSLTSTEVRSIVNTCADCQGHVMPPQMGVNPQGLHALQLWQTDIIHVAEFGRHKYVHVSIYTFSSIWASARTDWHLAFAVLGIPHTVKSDNGPAYALQKTWQFLQLWGVTHIFGILYSPTGQAIIEHLHGTLKRILEKQ
ncbi:hypothetical protein N310_03919, partial [Acanthisitta chloris]